MTKTNSIEIKKILNFSSKVNIAWRKTIEFHKTNDILSKYLKQFYLAKLTDQYFRAQDHTKEKIVSEKGRHAKKFVKKIIPQFVNRLFPKTANFTKDSATAEQKKARERNIRKFNN